MEFQVARWFSRRESGFKVALIPDAPSAESNEFVPGILGCTAPNRQFAASLAFPVKDSEIANAAINSLESRRKRGFQTGAGHLGEADASQPLKPADRKCGITIAYLATKTRRAARKAGDLLMLVICCRAVGNQGWQCNCHPNITAIPTTSVWPVCRRREKQPAGKTRRPWTLGELFSYRPHIVQHRAITSYSAAEAAAPPRGNHTRCLAGRAAAEGFPWPHAVSAEAAPPSVSEGGIGATGAAEEPCGVTNSTSPACATSVGAHCQPPPRAR